MSYRDLRDWISVLERAGELKRIRTEVDPILEVTEIADRTSKAGRAGSLPSLTPGGPARNVPPRLSCTASARAVGSPASS